MRLKEKEFFNNSTIFGFPLFLVKNKRPKVEKCGQLSASSGQK